jgi:nitrogen fixation protein FixH
MSATNTPAKGEFTGKHMLLVAIAFFGVIIAVNVTMAVLSATSWTGLVVQNSYVASQEFEEKRLAHLKQQAAGWQSDFSYAPGVVRLAVNDGAGNPVEFGEVKVLLNRPVGGHDDQSLTLGRAPDGGYVASTTLAEGVWDALVTARSETGPYELHARFKVEVEP